MIQEERRDFEGMNIAVKVITRAKKKEIGRDGAGIRVKLISLPRDGLANEELTGYLADFFGVRKSGVKIVRGEKDKRKIVSIPISEGEFEERMAGVENRLEGSGRTLPGGTDLGTGEA